MHHHVKVGNRKTLGILQCLNIQNKYKIHRIEMVNRILFDYSSPSSIRFDYKKHMIILKFTCQISLRHRVTDWPFVSKKRIDHPETFSCGKEDVTRWRGAEHCICLVQVFTAVTLFFVSGRFLFFEKFITLYSILPPFSVKIILFEIRYMFDFATLNLSAVNWHLFAETVTGSVLLYINLFLINVPLLYPLKTSENRVF